MRVYNIIVALILAAFIISPVIALETEQNINAVSIGDNTVQDIDNTMTVYDDSQDTSANQIGGNHNTQIVTSNKNIGIATQGQSQSQSIVLNMPKPDASYRGFDIGTINTQFISMYEGDPLVMNNDEYASEMIVSQPGDRFRYTVKSSIPVLAYIVRVCDTDRVLYDFDTIPVYDTITKKYDTANLDVAYMSRFRSSLQQFEFTVEDPARYAIVVDSRVSRNTDGRFTKINGNSFDVFVSIEKLVTNVANTTKIGTTNTFPNAVNGAAITTSANGWG